MWCTVEEACNTVAHYYHHVKLCVPGGSKPAPPLFTDCQPLNPLEHKKLPGDFMKSASGLTCHAFSLLYSTLVCVWVQYSESIKDDAISQMLMSLPPWCHTCICATTYMSMCARVWDRASISLWRLLLSRYINSSTLGSKSSNVF